MALYFFDIVDGRPYRGTRGIEFPNDFSAMREGHERARQMVEKGLHGRDKAEWNMVVRHDSGREVGSINFDDVGKPSAA
jgi:hypothetical protein